MNKQMKRFLNPPWYQRFTQSKTAYKELDPSYNPDINKIEISSAKKEEGNNREADIAFRGLAGIAAGVTLSGSLLFLKETNYHSPKLQVIFSAAGLAVTLGSFFNMVYSMGKSSHLRQEEK